MIYVIHTERSHIAFLFTGIAILLTLAGWSYRSFERDQEIADAVRSWREVNKMEASLDRYQKVIDFYTRIKPIPLKGESRD